MQPLKTLFLVLLSLFLPINLFGQPGNFHDSRDKVTISMMLDQSQVPQGGDAILAVILEHEDTWHAHTNNPLVPAELGSAEDYIATEIQLDVPEGAGVTIHEAFIQWPKSHTVNVGFGSSPVDYDVFDGTAIIYVPLTVNADAKLGNITINLKPVFQVCDDSSCMRPTPKPGDGSRWNDYGYPIEIEVIASDEAGNVALQPDPVFNSFDSSVFARIHAGEKGAEENIVPFDAFGLKFSIDTSGAGGLYLLLLVAMGGGFLLNLTPCVLPVIPIKIMGLSASAGSRAKTLLLGFWMMLGVMFLWLAIGFAIAGISSFSAINQLFQYPLFTICLGLFIGIMAIGMGGLFTIRLPNAVYKVNPKHDSVLGSFLFGIMTAVLSTPCTAPFMGAAAAWAAKQEQWLTLTVFGAIGFGMAVPYLVLAAFPKLVEKMPRAGEASELIKQVMGLLMLAAAAYFVGVGFSGIFQQEGAPPTRIYLWLVVLCVAASGVWLSMRTLKIAKRTGPKIAFVSIGALLAVASIATGFQLTDKGPIDWNYYTPEVLQSEIDSNHVTVIEFTAEWCLNCKLLENTVLNQPEIVELFKQEDVTPIKVDLTGNNESGNLLLNDVGGLRIPLLIINDGKGEEVFRGDFYTVDQILDAVQTAKGVK